MNIHYIGRLSVTRRGLICLHWLLLNIFFTCLITDLVNYYNRLLFFNSLYFSVVIYITIFTFCSWFEVINCRVFFLTSFKVYSFNFRRSNMIFWNGFSQFGVYTIRIYLKRAPGWRHFRVLELNAYWSKVTTQPISLSILSWPHFVTRYPILLENKISIRVQFSNTRQVFWQYFLIFLCNNVSIDEL